MFAAEPAGGGCYVQCGGAVWRGLVRRPQAGRHHRARTLQAEAAAQVR